MEDFIFTVVVAIFAVISVLGRVLKRQEERDQDRPKWPGPVAGPGLPGEVRPPQQDGPRPVSWPPWQTAPLPEAWPQQAGTQPVQPVQPPQPPQPTGEGVSLEGQRSEGFSSRGSFAEERARFRSETERFRRARTKTALHHPTVEVEVQEELAIHPVARALATRDGLAQAFLVSEVLGKPRALRPYGKR